jgi:prepilin-type N-terminal cleavage/methylation domain-containing protein/prepilin-type processing-associated H-X9-DG protein
MAVSSGFCEALVMTVIGRKSEFMFARESWDWRLRGFTLIELLIVLTTAAILAATLLPVFSRARQKAQQTGCLNSLKQLAAAYQMYQGDFNGDGIGYTNKQGAEVLWMNTMNAYYSQVNNARLCPTAATHAALDTYKGNASADWNWWINDSSYRGSTNGSYAFNGYLYADHVGGNSPARYFGKQSAITQASSVPLFCDAIWPDYWMDVEKKPERNLNMLSGPPDDAPYDGPDRILVSRHPLKSATAIFQQPLPGSINMAFVDGHASLFYFRDWKNLVWYKGYTPADGRVAPW